jgi:hypothetical protein
MPNYVINTIKIEGEQSIIDELMFSVKSDESNFDFEKIIPSPESMKIESGTNTDISLAIYEFEKTGSDIRLVNYLSYPWVKTENITNTSELCEYIKKCNRYSKELGRLAYENIIQYGCKDWYEWNCKYWGTKWNSSDSSSCGNTISFQTAWSTPYPVIEELSKKYPTISFTINYADEDIGSNCGTYKLQNGNLLENIKGDTVFACEMWGYDPADYDEAYARDKRIDEIIEEK